MTCAATVPGGDGSGWRPSACGGVSAGLGTGSACDVTAAAGSLVLADLGTGWPCDVTGTAGSLVSVGAWELGGPVM